MHSVKLNHTAQTRRTNCRARASKHAAANGDTKEDPKIDLVDDGTQAEVEADNFTMFVEKVRGDEVSDVYMSTDAPDKVVYQLKAKENDANSVEPASEGMLVKTNTMITTKSHGSDRRVRQSIRLKLG